MKARIMIAKPGLDGHDRGAVVVVQSLRDAGYDVIYTGLRRTPRQIAVAAAQEDVDVLGLSVLSGAHETLLAAIARGLTKLDWRPSMLLAGGIIPEDDIETIKRFGYDTVFGPGASLNDVANAIEQTTPHRVSRPESRTPWVKRAQQLTAIELRTWESNDARSHRQEPRPPDARQPASCEGRVIVLMGAGGIGKSTLIGSLLRDAGGVRIAVIANDPSGAGEKGSVLADRLRMPMDLEPETFLIRSLPVQDRGVGLSGEVGSMARLLAADFDLVLVETIGVGQNQVPELPWADEVVAVVSPGMGDHWQLRKTAYLEAADRVIVTKSDLDGADTFHNEVTQVLSDLGRSQVVIHRTSSTSPDDEIRSAFVS